MALAGQVVARRFDGTRFDCGDKLGYVRAVIHAALQNETTVADVADFLVRQIEDRTYLRKAPVLVN